MTKKIVLIGSEGQWGQKYRDLLLPKADNGDIVLFLIDVKENAPTTRDRPHVHFLHWYSDAEQIAQLDNLDTVLVSCPDRFHLFMAQAFAGRCKVLFVEKPLSDRVEEMTAFRTLLLRYHHMAHQFAMEAYDDPDPGPVRLTGLARQDDYVCRDCGNSFTEVSAMRRHQVGFCHQLNTSSRESDRPLSMSRLMGG